MAEGGQEERNVVAEREYGTNFTEKRFDSLTFFH